MKVQRTLLLAIFLTANLAAQLKDDIQPELNLPKPANCGNRFDVPMTARDKTCYWWSHTFTLSGFFGATTTAAFAQFRRMPPEWELGASGYAKRVFTRMAQSTTKGTAQYLTGLIVHEDPRSYGSGKKGVGPRLWFALSHAFIVRNDKGKERPAWGRFAGTTASGFVGMAWTPDPINSIDRAWIRTGTGYTGYITASLFKEFQPDLSRFAAALFRRPPKETPGPKTKTGARQ